jgi:hypothetical protein
MSNQKKWQKFNDECLHCGGEAEVLTDTGKDNLAYDGDEARCTDCGCSGYVVVYADEEEAYISWHDDPDCNCEWCKEYDRKLKEANENQN